MNKTRRHGFSLIEFMVYLVAFSCLISLTLQALVRVTYKARTDSLIAQKRLQLFTAVDVMAFEMAQAPHKKNRWHSAEKDRCIWHSNLHKKDIGYAVVDKKLVKISGVYSPQTQKWISKVTTPLAEAIDSCLFEFEWGTVLASSQLQTIQCNLISKQLSTTRKIVLNNGYYQ